MPIITRKHSRKVITSEFIQNQNHSLQLFILNSFQVPKCQSHFKIHLDEKQSNFKVLWLSYWHPIPFVQKKKYSLNIRCAKLRINITYAEVYNPDQETWVPVNFHIEQTPEWLWGVKTNRNNHTKVAVNNPNILKTIYFEIWQEGACIFIFNGKTAQWHFTIPSVKNLAHRSVNTFF